MDIPGISAPPVWLWIAGGLIAIAGVQTIRLADSKTDVAVLEQEAAKGRADRAEAYSKDSDQKSGKESTHAADTQNASDAYTADLPDRVASYERELAAADRLRIQAERRAATDRATAKAHSAAAVDQADRIAALESNAAEGLRVVAQYRKYSDDDRARIVLLCGQINADRKLMDSPQDACTGKASP